MQTLTPKWAQDSRVTPLISDLNEFYTMNYVGYSELHPEDTPERRMTGWEPIVWWKDIYILTAISDIEDQINAGGDAVIEINTSHSISRHPVTFTVRRSEIDWALEEVED